MTSLLKLRSAKVGRLTSLLAQIPLFSALYYLAFFLRFDGVVNETRYWQWAQVVPVVVVAKLVAFYYFRIFYSWVRPVTFHDLLLLGKAALGSALGIIVAEYVLFPNVATPRSVLLLDIGMTILTIGGTRSLLRAYQERTAWSLGNGRSVPVLIAGASHSGETLLRAIRRSPELNYHVVGFTSDDRQVRGMHIEGVPVLGMVADTCQLAARYGAREVLITAGDLPGREVRRLVDAGREENVNVKVLPSFEQLLQGDVRLEPRTVSVEDLLNRDPVQLDLPELHRWIDNRVLMVTGSAGSIGSEICRQLLTFSPKTLVMLDRWENGQFDRERELRATFPHANIEVVIGDITDPARMEQVFNKYQPDIVFHAAAYKHVPLMEANPGEAIKNIPLATRTLVDLAHEHSISAFVMISTDKAVNPTNIMGTCKRVAELYVQSIAQQSNCRFVTVRFGNVLDSAGSVVPTFREQIAKGGPVTVTHPEINRYFMTIPEASQLVIQAGAMGQGGEIFVLDMGEPVKIVDLATDMIRLCGLKPYEDIDITFCGLRPGEKLYEELQGEDEEHRPTSHAKIMVTASAPKPMLYMREATNRLEELADGSREEIVTELCRIVPGYHPSETVPQTTRRAA
ncbi:MAG: nucleoside-diphosphate sugar epimerase/dehydratase [Planctomycetaceae bacterium]